MNSGSAESSQSNYSQASQKFSLTRVVAASSAGTLIEWYDFYIFGSLATIISKHFFPAGNDMAALLSTLAIFATGFIVRPFGALFFGRIGDLVGRKYTFMLTLAIMGGATFFIGLLPSYQTIGIFAPILLVALRLLQGLALGGEYGGAATYIAEHSPDGKRGYYTSFIQTTATLGLFVSLGVILAVRFGLGEQDFGQWGWRIPFLLSMVLFLISYYIRVRMNESPLFAKARSEGKTSTNPIRESFTNPANLKLVLLALFGATAGQGVVWYTGQFYALYFLQTQLGVSLVDSNVIIAIALILGTPFFIVFGRLSDRIGRKPIILTGCLLGALTYFPLYMAMYQVKNPTMGDGVSLIQGALLVGIVLVQVLYVTMVYGPIAAFLVELFPTRIRYTSMSLPYHIGNGVFGGLVPFTATALVAATGNIYAGLVYPVSVAAICFVIGLIYLPQTHKNRFWD
ncbi:MAG: MFS transporter [Leptospiraceae bacterium]